MIDIPRTPTFEKNHARTNHGNGSTPCVVCGKAIKDFSEKVAWVHTWYGASIVNESEISGLDNAGDSGCYPVGNDCLQKHPEIKAYLQK